MKFKYILKLRFSGNKILQARLAIIFYKQKNAHISLFF